MSRSSNQSHPRNHRISEPPSYTAIVGPPGGFPQTLRHLGDLIRQQKRKKVLQEQNRQGKFDNSIGYHLLSPGQQPRKHPRRGQWGIKTRKTVGIPRNKTCHHPASKRDCSSQSSYLQGVKEPGAGSSCKETQATTRDRNLLGSAQISLSHKGTLIQLHFAAISEDGA